ncbi:MAG: hypothetical protein ABIM89_11885 [Mycobacteriales bacterium]
MRALVAVAVAAVTVMGAAACGDDDKDAPKAAASSVLSSASAAAASALSQASSAAASALSQVSSAAASVASDVPAGEPAPSPTGARPGDNTVRVDIEGKESKVYSPQNCAKVPGLDGFGFAGNVEGGGTLVISAIAGKGTIAILGGEVTGTSEFDNLVTNPDGTFYGTVDILGSTVNFYGHCDDLKT